MTIKKKGKGSVGVESYRGRLRLRLPRQVCKGQQRYLSLGLADTILNLKAAEVKARLIELDILTGNFDPSLDKYSSKVCSLGSSPKTLKELFNEYVKFKQSCQVSVSTIANDYARTQRVIAALPHKELTRDSAISARNWLLANYTPNLARRNLVQISACCSWGVNLGFIDFNPFQGLAKDIKLKRVTERNLGFSREERDTIISAFEDSKHYKFYAPFVKFLFLTGCRPSEAIALTWDDISDKFIRLHQAAVDTPKGISIKPGLKTQQERRFPINSQLSDLLRRIRTDTQNQKYLVFSGINGGIINFRNFCQRVWKVVLSTLAIDYQHPYTCRHTFISLCLMSGIDVKDVACWVGNSPEIIYRHYVGGKINLAVPEL